MCDSRPCEQPLGAFEVSVIVPVYNSATTLERCLEALCSTEQPFKEIIVIDDCSTDGSTDIARRYPVTLEALAENRGPSVARNRGAARATGEIIFFVDSDVAVAPDSHARIVEFFRTHPDMCACNGLFTTDCQGLSRASCFDSLKFRYFFRGRPQTPFTSACALRRDCFEHSGGFDESMRRAKADDIVLGWRMRQAGHTIGLNPELLSKHYKHLTFYTYCREYYFHTVAHLKAMYEYRNRTGPKRHFEFAYSIPRMVNLLAMTAFWFLIIPALGLAIAWASPTPVVGLTLVCGLAVTVANGGLLLFLARCGGIVFALYSLLLILAWGSCNVAAVLVGTWQAVMSRRADPSGSDS